MEGEYYGRLGAYVGRYLLSQLSTFKVMKLFQFFFFFLGSYCHELNPEFIQLGTWDF